MNDLEADFVPTSGFRQTHLYRRVEFLDLGGSFDDRHTLGVQILHQEGRKRPVLHQTATSNLPHITSLRRGETALFVVCDNGASYGRVVGQIWP